MASTPASAQLTEAHRVAQVRLSAETVSQLHRAWPLLDIRNLDATTARWLEVATRIVQSQRGTSARLAAQYLRLFRQLETGETIDFAPDLLVNTEALTTSLRVTGPIQLKTLQTAGTPLLEAAQTALLTSSAAAMRHAMNGGRDTIATAVTSDPKCIGYARVTSGRPCAFCAMLASRGPVYESKASATVAFMGDSHEPGHYHDGCLCTAEPIYRDGTAWPAGTKQYMDLWQSSTDGKSGKNAVNAFRRALEASR